MRLAIASARSRFAPALSRSNGAHAGIGPGPQARRRFLPRELPGIARLLPQAGRRQQSHQADHRRQDHARARLGNRHHLLAARTWPSWTATSRSRSAWPTAAASTTTAARALAREGKAIVHIDGGLHSTEVAGAQHSILLAYKLVSAQGDPEVDAILDNVILMLWPTLNPDGQERGGLLVPQEPRHAVRSLARCPTSTRSTSATTTTATAT